MKSIFSILALFISVTTFSQNIQWAKSSGGKYDDMAYNSATDALGNFYFTGYFRDTARFDTTILLSYQGGMPDVFVTKCNASGQFSWAVRTGGSDVDHAYGICADSAGNSYIVGDFKDQALIGTTTFNGPGAFIAALDPQGNWLWSRAITTTLGNTVRFNDVAVDDSGNCYVAGYTNQTITIGTSTLVKTGSENAFVAKLAPNGLWLWAVMTTGIDYQHALCIGLDVNGDCYVAGECRDECVFGTDTVRGFGQTFVSKLSSAGQWLWTTQTNNDVTSSYFCRANDLVVGDLGNVYLTGEYGGEIIFGSDTILGHFANIHAWMAKINSLGQWQWVHAPGTHLQHDYGFGIAIDRNFNKYFSGSFADDLVFGSANLTTNGVNNIFVAKMNAADQWEWATNASGCNSYFNAHTVVANDNAILIGGAFWDTAVFGTTTLVSNTPGAADIFITMLDNLPTNISSFEATTLNLYPNPAHNHLIIPGSGEFQLFNLLGKKCFSKQIDGEKTEVDLSGLKVGIYIAKLQHKRGGALLGKIIVE